MKKVIVVNFSIFEKFRNKLKHIIIIQTCVEIDEEYIYKEI